MAIAAAVSIGAGVAAGIAGVVGAAKKRDAAASQQRAAKKAAEPSARELKAIQSSLDNSRKTIERERKVIDAVDPTIM